MAPFLQSIPALMNSLIPYNSRFNWPSLDWDFDRLFDWPRRNWQAETLENGDTILTFDLPGYKAEEVSIEYKDDTITIRAENKRGRVAQSFTAPNIDPEKAAAKLENGLLTLQLVEREEAKPKRIAIS